MSFLSVTPGRTLRSAHSACAVAVARGAPRLLASCRRSGATTRACRVFTARPPPPRGARQTLAPAERRGRRCVQPVPVPGPRGASAFPAHLAPAFASRCSESCKPRANDCPSRSACFLLIRASFLNLLFKAWQTFYFLRSSNCKGLTERRGPGALSFFCQEYTHSRR